MPQLYRHLTRAILYVIVVSCKRTRLIQTTPLTYKHKNQALTVVLLYFACACSLHAVSLSQWQDDRLFSAWQGSLLKIWGATHWEPSHWMSSCDAEHCWWVYDAPSPELWSNYRSMWMQYGCRFPLLHSHVLGSETRAWLILTLF